jgi:hypothetical protein
MPLFESDKSQFWITGYKPFLEACIDAGQKTEVLKYIPKLADPREGSEVYSWSTKNAYNDIIIIREVDVFLFFLLRRDQTSTSKNVKLGSCFKLYINIKKT